MLSDLNRLNQAVSTLFVPTAQAMGINNVCYISSTRTTGCDVMCTTNTPSNLPNPEAASSRDQLPPVQQARLPYEQPMRLGGKPKVAATRFQKMQHQEVRQRMIEQLLRDRQVFYERLQAERVSLQVKKHRAVVKIQALFRGFRFRRGPLKYFQKRKQVKILTSHELYDELCAFARALKFRPIPGLSLEPRTRASQRRQRLEIAACRTILRFFRMVLNRKMVFLVMRKKKKELYNRSSRIISRAIRHVIAKKFGKKIDAIKREEATVVIQKYFRRYLAKQRFRKARSDRWTRWRYNEAAIILQRNLGNRHRSNLKLASATMASLRSFRKLLDLVISRMIDELLAPLLEQGITSYREYIAEVVMMATERSSQLLQNELVDNAIDMCCVEFVLAEMERLAVEKQRITQEHRQLRELYEMMREEERMHRFLDEEQRLKEEEERRLEEELRAREAEKRRKEEEEKRRQELLVKVNKTRVELSRSAAMASFNQAVNKLVQETLQRFRQRILATFAQEFAEQITLSVLDQRCRQIMALRRKVLEEQPCVTGRKDDRLVVQAVPKLALEHRDKSFAEGRRGTFDSDSHRPTPLPKVESITPLPTNHSAEPFGVESMSSSNGLAPNFDDSEDFEGEEKEGPIDALREIASNSYIHQEQSHDSLISESVLDSSSNQRHEPEEGTESLTRTGESQSLNEDSKAYEENSVSGSYMPETLETTHTELTEDIRVIADLYRLSRYEKAMNAASLAVEKNIRLLDDAKASDSVEKALPLSMSYSVLLMMYARIRVALAYYHEALSSLTVAQNALVTLLPPNHYLHAEPLLVASEAQGALGHYDEAFTLLAHAYNILNEQMRSSNRTELGTNRALLSLYVRYMLLHCSLLLRTGQYYSFDESMKHLRSCMIEYQQDFGFSSFELMEDYQALAAQLHQLRGDYLEAIRIHQELLTDRSTEYGDDLHIKIASSYASLGRLSLLYGDLSQAHEYIGKAMEMRLSCYPAYHPAIAATHLLAADLFLTTGRYAEALQEALAALQSFQQKLGLDHPATGSAILRLASIHMLQGDLAAATSALSDAKDIFQQRFGGVGHHLRLMECTVIEGRLLLRKGSLLAAVDMLNHALEQHRIILQMMKANDNEELTLSTVAVSVDVAMAVAQIGDLSYADGILAQCLTTVTSKLQLHEGAHHYMVAAIYYAQGCCCKYVGNYEDAKTLFVTSYDMLFSIYRSQNGLHPQIAMIIAESADNLRIVGMYEQAVEVSAMAVNLMMQMTTPQLAQDPLSAILHYRGQLLCDIGAYAEAEKVLLYVLQAQRERCGDSTGAFAVSLSTLASVLRHQKRYDEAEHHVQMAMETMAANHGVESVPYQLAAIEKALLHMDTMRWSSAMQIMTSSIPILAQRLGDSHPWVEFAVVNLRIMEHVISDFSEMLEFLTNPSVSVDSETYEPMLDQLVNSIAQLPAVRAFQEFCQGVNFPLHHCFLRRIRTLHFIWCRSPGSSANSIDTGSDTASFLSAESLETSFRPPATQSNDKAGSYSMSLYAISEEGDYSGSSSPYSNAVKSHPSVNAGSSGGYTSTFCDDGKDSSMTERSESQTYNDSSLSQEYVDSKNDSQVTEEPGSIHSSMDNTTDR